MEASIRGKAALTAKALIARSIKQSPFSVFCGCWTFGTCQGHPTKSSVKGACFNNGSMRASAQDSSIFYYFALHVPTVPNVDGVTVYPHRVAHSGLSRDGETNIRRPDSGQGSELRLQTRNPERPKSLFKVWFVLRHNHHDSALSSRGTWGT